MDDEKDQKIQEQLRRVQVVANEAIHIAGKHINDSGITDPADLAWIFGVISEKCHYVAGLYLAETLKTPTDEEKETTESES